jgi:hypothetical protein
MLNKLARCVDDLEAFCVDRGWFGFARFFSRLGVRAWGIRVEDGKVHMGRVTIRAA